MRLFSIPREAVRYILFQRTDYLVHRNNRWLNSLVSRIPFLTYKRMVAFETWLLSRRIERLYVEDMKQEYQTMKEALPADPQAILDIGCGVAGIDMFLDQHYRERGKSVDFHLLDRTETHPQIYYGLEKVASYYNSLAVARDVLQSNGTDAGRIHLQEVDGSPIFPGTRFDLVISLLSWGFHYPVETYLEETARILKPGGRLIIDVRKGSGGAKLLEAKFGAARRILKDAEKHQRLLFENVNSR